MIEDQISKELKSDFLRIIQEINKAKRIIITSHENPDGDSIGSSLAMRYYLDQKGIECKVVFHNSIPSVYKFLPCVKDILIYSDAISYMIDWADMVIILDVSVISRMKEFGQIIARMESKKVMIDHHLNPENIADYVAINSKASATGELIWQLIQLDEQARITNEMALCIYTAVMTDTGGFRFSNTTQLSHLIAGEAIQYGIDVSMVYDEVYNQMEHKVLKQLGRAFANSELYLNGKLHILCVQRHDMIELGLSAEDLNNFSEKTLAVQGTTVGVLISDNPEEENILKLSFRSKPGIDIRQVAQVYGGGGHKNAAGAKVRNRKIEELKAEIVEKIAEII